MSCFEVTIPQALQRGDTIAFISPSARLNNVFPLRVARARKFLESQGFAIREIFTAELGPSFRSAVAVRAAEVHAAFSDSSVKAIICCIGGMTANELIPALDYDLIRRHPKIFVGSSDITLLHHALFVGAGLRTFYGPSVITQLAEFPKPIEFTWNHFCQVLVNESDAAVGPLPRAVEWTEELLRWEDEPENLRARKMRPSTGWKWLRAGKAQGRLWGGCLPSVLQLFGSRWEVDMQDKILLLELPEGLGEYDAWPMELVQYNLGDLGMLGVWDKIAGLVLGRPFLHTEANTKDWERTVLELTEGYEFPILAGVDVGHTDPMLTIPLDARCRIDSERDEWAILERGVLPRADRNGV